VTTHNPRTRRRPSWRLVAPIVATLALVTPLAWTWWQSLLPDRYSVMEFGYVDLGGGQPVTHALAPGQGRSVSTLVADPQRPADVTYTLTARKQSFHLASGERTDGYTINGTSPGPTLRARQGDLVEVHLVNESVPDGVTLHWHGVDVPNAEDGVAGVTQNAVPPGKTFTYRFVADHSGTYWYHSHQVSHEQVRRGLFGMLVIEPSRPLGSDRDVVAVSHVYDGKATVNGRTSAARVEASPGDTVRVRIVNTDNGSLSAWVSASYRVVAVDGYDLNGPTPVSGKAVLVTAGGRVDIEVTMPTDGGGVRVDLGGAAALLIGDGNVADKPQPTAFVDLLHYGSPTSIGFDPADADRQFRYSIGRKPGFIDGRPGYWWSVNGHIYPDVPMFMVREGDIVTFHIENHTNAVHPMHLHGHHAVVIRRNGDRATGSPWWVDSLDVSPGDSYDIAFVADNPGIWMDHCHNLPHAAQGLVAHLVYSGVYEPYRVGGKDDNQPE
jgi:FtsP/CotA-like multicopper oxidase with cupredoxin domain